MADPPDFFRRRARTGHAADCSLADLGIPAVSRDAARKLLEGVPEKNRAGRAQLRRQHVAQFSTWLFELEAGFSLCFYGFGSKYSLLKEFADCCLSHGTMLAVSGLQRGVTAHQVLVHAAAAHRHEIPANLRIRTSEQLLDMIMEHSAPLAVVLHNIEGPGLRTRDAQALLSQLAACPNVNFVASFDDINMPVLWDDTSAGRFNWLLHDVTNFEPYVRELADARTPSLLAGGRSQATDITAAEVLKSLPPKARKIFAILVEHTQDKGGPGGVGFHKLFKQCRSKFLVGNEANLKAHLTEFRDHELLRERRAEDGAELLYVPLPEDALANVLKGVQLTN